MDVNRSKDPLEDKDLQEGIQVFEDISKKANAIAEEFSKILIERSMSENEKYNLTTCMLGVAKILPILASFMYDSEEEFLVDVRKSRVSVTSDIIPALLAAEPCGKCEECKNGNPDGCIHPNVREDYTTSRFLPLLVENLIEYDLFNKVIYTTMKKSSFDEAVKEKGATENGK